MGKYTSLGAYEMSLPTETDKTTGKEQRGLRKLG